MNGPVSRKTKPWVGVGGPWSKPDPCINVHEIIKKVKEIEADGICFPICPMIESHLMQIVYPCSYEINLNRCLEVLVGCCDAYFYLPGESSGVNKEIEVMITNGIPVFKNKSDLYYYFGATLKVTGVEKWVIENLNR